MKVAIELSKKGFPAPNPHVGCVIVKNGEIVGRGFHNYAGGPHAEVEALKQADKKSEGADVFVTLEPCRHFGRTPPCTQALIAAKVRQVFFAVADPNPAASGGADVLRSAGILVHQGLLQDEASRVNHLWLTAVQRRSPFVGLKVAMSLDGRIALPNGTSQWITNEKARTEGRRLRCQYGSVLVGRKTIQTDNPLLTSRIKGVVNEPARFVLDAKASLSGQYHVFQGEHPAVRFVEKAAVPYDREIAADGGGFDLKTLLAKIYEYGNKGVLIEGGAITAKGFLDADLVDRLHLFVGNVILGDGPPWVTGQWKPLEDAIRWRLNHTKTFGECVELIYDRVL